MFSPYPMQNSLKIHEKHEKTKISKFLRVRNVLIQLDLNFYCDLSNNFGELIKTKCLVIFKKYLRILMR